MLSESVPGSLHKFTNNGYPDTLSTKYPPIKYKTDSDKRVYKTSNHTEFPTKPHTNPDKFAKSLAVANRASYCLYVTGAIPIGGVFFTLAGINTRQTILQSKSNNISQAQDHFFVNAAEDDYHYQVMARAIRIRPAAPVSRSISV